MSSHSSEALHATRREALARPNCGVIGEGRAPWVLAGRHRCLVCYALAGWRASGIDRGGRRHRKKRVTWCTAPSLMGWARWHSKLPSSRPSPRATSRFTVSTSRDAVTASKAEQRIMAKISPGCGPTTPRPRAKLPPTRPSPWTNVPFSRFRGRVISRRRRRQTTDHDESFSKAYMADNAPT